MLFHLSRRRNIKIGYSMTVVSGKYVLRLEPAATSESDLKTEAEYRT